MRSRDKLKELYQAKEELTEAINSETEEYIFDLNGKHGIYITDHAIVRYLERVKGYTYPPHMSDESKLEVCQWTPQSIRKEMLTLEEDRIILTKQLNFFNRGDYGYVVKNMAIVTVVS